MSPEMMARKYFLLELLQFFIEKRQSVFMDSDFNFSIREFKKYARQKQLSTEQLSCITWEKMTEHLDCCTKTPRRDKNLFVINPETPLLTYTAHARGRDGFTVKNCRTEYLETTRSYIRKTLGIGNDAERNDIENDAKAQLYITKDNEYYYFEGNRIFFKNPKADYAIIFDAAFSLKPGGGAIEYKKIIDGCNARGLKGIDKRAILRAISGESANFSKHADGGNLTTKYGIPFFNASGKGKEITFNNRK